MARLLVTGMSGTGKTSVLEELRERGYVTLDTDYDGWVLPDGRWDEPRMEAYLDKQADVVVAGTVENQERLSPRFGAIVLQSGRDHPLPRGGGAAAAGRSHAGTRRPASDW